MCKSIADGGQRCLSHMSAQISPEFGEAYKGLSLAKKGVIEAGGVTSAYLEEIGKCGIAISKAGLSDETATVAYKAMNSVIVDVLKSAEKNARLVNGEYSTPKFAADRKAARTARTLAQQNLSDCLEKNQAVTQQPKSDSPFDGNTVKVNSRLEEPVDDMSECLGKHTGACEGETLYRESLSGTGTAIARCDYHWDEALDRDEKIRHRYPHDAPSDFDPGYAGESWDGDY